MKIVRYQNGNEISFGKLVDNKIKLIKGNIFDNFTLEENYISLNQVKLLPPVVPSNIIAIGINYKDHARESGHEIPDRPVVFIKATNSVIGPGEDIILPHMAPDEVDFEAELAVIIAKKAFNIKKDEVDDYILGFSCANDITARDCQKKIDRQWARAKSFDTFCPIGPVIETDLNYENLNIKSKLNDKIMQNSNTSNLIFGVREIISYLSKNMTLLPGTIILTGTPPGVGFARKPPVYLQDGDEITVEIEGIGLLTNKVSI